MGILAATYVKLKERFRRAQFRYRLRRIRSTPPLNPGNEPFTVLSMVHHRDVECYLLAIKSFARFLAPRGIVVVMDPSITSADRRLIAEHVPEVELLRAEDFRDPDLPQGGCWERLIAISDRVNSDYVVQLDADTVTLSDIPEVRAAVTRQQSFVLGTADGQDFVSCQAAADWAKSQATENEHVQGVAEMQLDRLPNSGSRRYVRGCAGFSGFAPHSFSRRDLRELSAAMSHHLGSKWSAWGTEQFASNLIIANTVDALVLPHPKYCHPGMEQPVTVFLHFIGYVRFQTGRYARAASELCAALGAPR